MRRPSLRPLVCGAGLLSIVWAGSPASAQTVAITLDELLFRASEGVVAYQSELTELAAEERYTQRAFRGDEQRRSRTLLSDVVIARLPEGDGWGTIRDVFEVDGKVLRERDDRLARLFAASPAQAAHRDSRKIEDESVKQYFEGGQEGRRHGTAAMLGVVFLHPINQYRYYFEKVGEEKVGDVSTWIVRFTEHMRPTLFSSGRGDIFTRGRFWLETGKGRIVKSEVFLGDQNSASQTKLVTTYRFDPTLGTWVPTELAETYEYPKDPRRERLEMTATYSNFRKLGAAASLKSASPQP